MNNNYLVDKNLYKIKENITYVDTKQQKVKSFLFTNEKEDEVIHNIVNKDI